MILSEFKNHLKNASTIELYLPNHAQVPLHFHVTELGQIQKRFVDCGGTVRQTQNVRFQLWIANDIDHRLTPEKFLGIIEKAEQDLQMEDVEVTFEYQAETIQLYGLSEQQGILYLTALNTACLAPDLCMPKQVKTKISLKDLTPDSETTTCCTPGGKCC